MQSRTIRVWLKTFLVGGESLLPRATSLMQKTTSWRCFVRCFYIKHFSSIVLVCQWEIVHLFSSVHSSLLGVKVFPTWPRMATRVGICFGERQPSQGLNFRMMTYLCFGFVHVQLLVLPGVVIKGSFGNYRVKYRINPQKGT